jgi:hypothetical protein
METERLEFLSHQVRRHPNEKEPFAHDLARISVVINCALPSGRPDVQHYERGFDNTVMTIRLRLRPSPPAALVGII